MAIETVWRGDGHAVDMWLLQMDLANHSRWTAGLGSMIEAYRSRREFALNVEKRVTPLGFARLAWGGDGGIFAADSRRPIEEVLRAAEAAHEVFGSWSSNIPGGDILRLRISAHRTRVTTADDPAYCYGSGLNDFMKRERSLDDPGSETSIVITAAVYEELTFAGQREWSQLGQTLGTLGPIYARRAPVATTERGVSYRVAISSRARSGRSLNWLAGAWENIELGSWAYVRVAEGRAPHFVYCYGADTKHTGNYRLDWVGESIAGSFSWVDSPISGVVLLNPNKERNRLKGGWWYAEDVPVEAPLSLANRGMTPLTWVKRKEKVFPAWARTALREL